MVLIVSDGQEINSTFYRGTRIEAEVERVRYLRPDIAVVDIDSRLHWPDNRPSFTAHALAIVEKRPPGWQMVAFQNMVPHTPVPPVPA